MEQTDFNKIGRVGDIASSIVITPSQLAILWCMKNENVSTVILGASKVSQLKENLDSLNYIDDVTDDIMTQIHR